MSSAPDSGADHLAAIEALHGRAREAIEQYQPERASALLDQADTLITELTGDVAESPAAQELAVRLLLTRSWTVAERSGPGAGQDVLARATGLARHIGRQDLQTLCLTQAASMLGRGGDLPGALGLMNQAEVGLHLLPLPDQARLLVNRGTLALQLMQLDRARTDLARSAELAERADAPTLLFMARHNLGYVEFLRGDLPAALSLMDAADAMQVDVSRSVAQLDRARVLLEAGLLDDALDSLTTARRLAEADAGDQDLGEIELDLARLRLLLADPAGSAAAAADAGRRFGSRDAGAWRRTAHLVELEALGAGGTQPRETARLAEALGRSAETHGETHLARRAALVAADAWLALNGPDALAAARAAYQRARPLLRTGTLATRLHLRLVAARLADHPRRAGEALATAADDLAQAQQRAASLDLRAALAVHGTRLANLDLNLGMASGSVVSLFTRAERWRAVSDRVPFVRPPSDPRAAEASTRLRRLRQDLRQAPPEQHSTLRAQAAALERQIKALHWAHGVQQAPGTRPPRPLPYAEVLQAVRMAEVTLASYLPHAGHLYAVVLTPRGGRIVRLGSIAAIASTVHRVRADADAARLPGIGAMRAAVESSLIAGLTTLDEALLGQLATAATGAAGSPIGRLVVVPSRQLASVPWGMLPSRRGRATSVARTASAWAAAVGAQPVVQPRVLAITGPELEYAASEVASVAATWSAAPTATLRQLDEVEATRAAVAAAIPKADLIHIAAHGRHQHQSPLFSTLRLADGDAFAYELPEAGLVASHAVLSACEVGRATIRAGDESLGLAAVLQSLGVRSVVAATTRIPDELAATAMTAYHKELVTGSDSAEALAVATAELPLAARAFTCLGGPWRIDPRGGQSTSPSKSTVDK